VWPSLLNRLKHRFVSTGLYLAMGWVVVFAAGPLVSRLPAAGLTLLVAGGLLHAGRLRVPAGQPREVLALRHLLVLGGSVCHFFAALWYAYG
jgi:hemolysin III